MVDIPNTTSEIFSCVIKPNRQYDNKYKLFGMHENGK